MSSQKSFGLGGSVIGLLLTGFGLLILAGAILRESPMFWRDAGGYTVGMRELVSFAFYPAFGLYLVLIINTIFFCWKLLRDDSNGGTTLILACGINLMLFAVIVMVVAWNNLINISDGLPLHYHGS